MSTTTREFDQQTRELPPELIPVARDIWEAATQALGHTPNTGGCLTFRDPKTWDEQYGRNAVLIVIHDGGDFAPLINLDYEQYTLHDKFYAAIPGRWLLEPQTCWYAALYAPGEPE